MSGLRCRAGKATGAEVVARRYGKSRIGLVLTLTWFGLSAWFLWGAPSDAASVLGPIPRSPAISAADIDPAPPREPLADPPMVTIGGVKQRCSDCHAIFSSLEVTPSNIKQHQNVRLEHGMNDRCFNCHSRTDRDKLILHDRSEIGFGAAALLCAQCHGTVYRDWQRGTHGRTQGSWDASSKEHSRLVCTQCHDPHAPRFAPIAPLPGPNTWRMGEHDSEMPTHGSESNPLERWKH